MLLLRCSPLKKPHNGLEPNTLGIAPGPIMNVDEQNQEGACHRPGETGDGWGPGGQTGRQGSVRHEDGIPTRTGTRPPHPPHPTPCPYRTGGRRRAMNPGYVACQICTVLSLLPEAIRVPLGDHATEVANLVCPR